MNGIHSRPQEPHSHQHQHNFHSSPHPSHSSSTRLKRRQIQPVTPRPTARRRGWRFLYVEDEYTGFLKWRVRNSQLCCLLASCQLVITIAALAQHVFSLIKHDKIFYCRFASRGEVTNSSSFLAADIIIFDFGLFHRLLKASECIANHLDGGYMRFLWCLNQTCTLVGLLCLQALNNPHPWLLVPTLATETFYVMGMGVLTLATGQSLLKSIIGYDHLEDSLFFLKLTTYFVGMFANVFFDYVLWHYYWFIEANYKRFHPNAAFL